MLSICLERMGLEYVHETFGNRVERFFRYLKQRTKRFYNNINTENIESIVDSATAIAIVRRILIEAKLTGSVIPT